jgi:zinc-binding in reverse transcriptase
MIIGQFRPPDWLNTTENLKILGITFEENLKRAAENNWSRIVNNIRQMIWCHSTRDLNLLQKVTLCNTFILSKAWFVAAILPLAKKWADKIISQVGLFLWRGSALRVSFEQLTLHRTKGGLGLNAPGEKAKALFLSSFLRNSKTNNFIAQFFIIQNPPYTPGMPKIQYIKKAITEISYLPSEIINNPNPPRPKILYQHFFLHFSIIEPLPSKNWKIIWKNIHGKFLPSKARSFWYILVNRKLPLRSTLFRQNRTLSPNCLNCDQSPETLDHKFAGCIHSREMWTYIQREVQTLCGKMYRFEELAFPDQIVGNRTVKHKTIKMFAIYLNFIENTDLESRNIENLKTNLQCEIF